MNDSLTHPPFGLADLTNCERELIHLAASIQPHGVLLVLNERDLSVVQASENTKQMLGLPVDAVLTRNADMLGGNFVAKLTAVIKSADLSEPAPLACSIDCGAGIRDLEGTVHRHVGGGLIVELEPAPEMTGLAIGPNTAQELLQKKLAAAVQRFSGALSIASLSDAVVQCFRDMTGYDRVMVYKFDPDGHGEIIAEARDPKLDSLLGHRYPASDIPQRARELYIRNRARVLGDAGYTPVPLVPRRFPGTQDELDMSLCYLRSMSPLHIQYLKNMGVTGTLVVSLVREGRLWGLIACHHYAPLGVRYSVRAASELLAEVISTRIAAIENYVQAQVEVLVRRLELRLLDATSTDGDWRVALFQNPKTLLQPFDATGAALVYDGQVMTTGDVPSTQDLRALADWVSGQTVDSIFGCSALAKANPSLSSIKSTVSGVLAVELSSSRPDFLMWFRREQVSEVIWAGDPAKPVIDNDPLNLSPRRSFAAWSEIVRGTAIPWTKAETVLARAIGSSLVDIILQIQAVRLLIAQHQLIRVRAEVANSKEPVVIADHEGRVLFSSESFSRLLCRPEFRLGALLDLAECFFDRDYASSMLASLVADRAPWRGELAIRCGDGQLLPVGVRADVVPGPVGAVLGFIVILTDLTDKKSAEVARNHFERAISLTEMAETLKEPGTRALREPDEVMSAILANANLAAVEIADAAAGASVAPLLEELEVSTKRATFLYRQFRAYTQTNQGEQGS
jgi:light-regulated signal transduction histidine kinase (bacteriophytochrome)